MFTEPTPTTSPVSELAPLDEDEIDTLFERLVGQPATPPDEEPPAEKPDDQPE